MAAGPIFPHSVVPVTAGNTFDYIYVGAGAGSKYDAGMGVAASIAADSTWALRFQLPPAIPTGTAKLLFRALANATSGAAKLTPSLVVVAGGASPSGATLAAEAQQTFTWGAGDNDKYKDIKLTIANTSIAAGSECSELVCSLVFNTTGWTLAQVSCWTVSLIWE